MSGETETFTVPVTVEWALWGKERHDLEYRLLRWSNGTLGAANFDELLTRYATGTLEALPQVTISWFEDQAHRHHIALSIHEEPEDRRVDATGRPVVLTRCFCVPYATLAQGLVSYQAMYEVFRKIPLHERVGTIETSLPVMRPGAGADSSALRAAALLVTCKPVCILEADQVSLPERLTFIDSVMSLLPYGLRCQLSASTWASSQFWEHKFRLFFSSARRPDDECDVIWGGDRRPITQYEAGTYLNWLQDDAPDLASQLAKRGEQLAGAIAPVRFKGADVDQLLSELYDHPGGSRRRPRSPAPPPPEPSVGERRERSIEDLLIDCADRIGGNDQFLVMTAIRRLTERRHGKATAEEQDRYRRIIKEHRLLTEDGSLGPSLQAALYEALLDIAFEIPLDYEGYCQLEVCAGLAAGHPVHSSLLRAASQAGISDICARLLVASADDSEFRAIVRDQVPLARLIGAVADLKLDAEHRRVIYETVVSELEARERNQRLDAETLRSALAEHACLAPEVQRVYHDPQGRLGALRVLLALAYRQPLSRPDIRAVLWSSDYTPTVDLFFTVMTMADPANAEFAERTYIRKLARRYNTETRSIFLRWFPEHDSRGAGDENLQPASGGAEELRSLKQQTTPWRQPRKTGSHVLQRLPAIQVPARRQASDRTTPAFAMPQRVNWIRVIVFVLAFVVGCILAVLVIVSRIA